jgi:hypothetical protein
VGLEEMARPGPGFPWQDLDELVVDFDGVRRSREPQALGHPEDVGVDSDRLLAEGVA